MASDEELIQALDPVGYEETMHALEPADEETAAAVSSALAGWEYSSYFPTMGVTMRLGFEEGNVFTLLAMGTTPNSGTYTVGNGYPLCYYPGNENPSIIAPWKWDESQTNGISVSVDFDMAGGLNL